MDAPVKIRISQPADLVSLLPHLLGFHPTHSLVIVALQDRSVLVSARMDLPDGLDDRPTYRAALDNLAANLAGHGATAALLVGYDTPQSVIAAVQIATAALTAVGITVPEALRVHDGRFYSLLCANPDCCPPEGTPFDPATVAAATAIYAGMTVLPDRDSLAGQLAPITGSARDAFAEATAVAGSTILEFLETTAQPDEDLLDLARTAWAEAGRCYRAGGVLDDTRAAMFTVLLDLPPVANDTARRTNGEDWQIRMWTDLVRRAEPLFVAQPANMLALSALQSGAGALATLAIARALDAEPSNGLTNIVATIHGLGLAPHEVTAVLRG